MIFLRATGFLLLVTSSLSIEVQKCKLTDHECVKQSTQKMLRYFADSIPEYKVQRMDPFTNDLVSAVTPSFNFTLKNLVVTGLKQCEVTKMIVENQKMVGQAICNLNVEADYDINGKILVLPITGNGKIHVKLRKLIVDAEAALTEVTAKDGKKHWKLKTFTYKYDLKEKSHIRMDNLFNGNAALSGAINELFDSSPNEVILELSPTIVADLTKRLAENVNHFFDALPVEDLTLH